MGSEMCIRDRSSAHSQAVKLGTVEQFPEYQWHLPLDDSGPVVLNRNGVPFAFGAFDSDPDLWDDPRFFTGIQRNIDSFLDRRKQSLAPVVKTE